MESLSTITTWEPPHRFVADSRDDMGPDDPTVATEWIVEALRRTCVVRVVHGWFTSSDDWDDQFEGHTHGWISFFRVLRLYLEHFRGQPGSPFQLMGVAPEPKSEAWEALTSRLGRERRRGGQAGEHVTSRATSHGNRGMGGPARVARRAAPPARRAGYRYRPSRSPRDGWSGLSIDPFLFHGDQAPAAVARAEPMWQAWMNEHFPITVGPEAVTTS